MGLMKDKAVEGPEKGAEGKGDVRAERDEKTGQFLPGHSGGPGRPKVKNSLSHLMTDMLDEMVRVPDPEKKGKFKTITYRQAFVESQMRRAINGDGAASRNLWERVEGKVIIPMRHEMGDVLGDEDAKDAAIENELDAFRGKMPEELDKEPAGIPAVIEEAINGAVDEDIEI